VDIDAVIALGMLPPVNRSVVETIANGAGFGAAMFLSDEGFSSGEVLAARTQQIELDQDANFHSLYINALHLAPNGSE
jgi:uncharacterized 2Fe-2S/4Fe-4S cluster protein (DUF4445 family)